MEKMRQRYTVYFKNQAILLKQYQIKPRTQATWSNTRTQRSHTIANDIGVAYIAKCYTERAPQELVEL